MAYTEITTTITTVVDLETAKSKSSVDIQATQDLPNSVIRSVVAAACRVTADRMLNGVVVSEDDEGDEEGDDD